MHRIASLLLFFLTYSALSAQVKPDIMLRLGKELIEAINDRDEVKADSLADSYLSYCVSDAFCYGKYYAEAKHVKALTAAAAGDYTSAVALMDEVLKARLDKRVYHENIRIGDSYFDRGEYNFLLKQTDQAICDMQAAADAYLMGRADTLYAKALCQKAYYYNRRGAPGDSELEDECYEKAFPHTKKGTRDYLLTGNHLVIAYREQGEAKKADKLANQLQKTAKKVFQATPLYYADILLNAAVTVMESRQYTKAFDLADEATAIYETNHVVNLNYATSIKTAADASFYLEQYEKADSLYEKAIPLLRKIEDAKWQVYPGCLQQLIETNKRLGHPDKVTKYTKELDKLPATSDTTTLEYADRLATQAQIEANKGNYNEAIAKGELALSNYKARNDFRRQVLMLNELSNFYSHTGQYQLADSLSELAIKISHEHHFIGEEAEAHHQEAKSLLNKRKYQKADEECLRALSLLTEANQTKSTKYASILGTRAVIQNKQGNIQTAIDITHKALDIQTEVLGAEHSKNVKLLDNLAIFYDKLGNMDSVAHYYHRAITLQTELVRNNFSLKGTEERELFWQRESYPYQRAALYAAEPDKASPALLADIYNAQLFTKGILLNSEIDFRKVIQKSGDKDVLQKYDEMMTRRAELQQCQTAEEGGTEDRIKQLKHDINKLENDIVYKCKEYGDFTQSLKLTTDSIRQALAPDEAAVEIFETGITYGGQPDRLYLALIMRKEWDTPHACQLFFRSDIEELGYPANVPVSRLLNDTTYQNRIYNDCKLGKLIWKNLLKEIDGATRIYFAPTGIFYQWGIEYMPFTDEGTRISDSLAVFRLSSTKLLAQRSTDALFGNGEAVVYGGLGYDMSKDEIRKYKDGKEEVYESYADLLPEELQLEEGSIMLASSDAQSLDSLAVIDMTRQGIVPVGLLKGASEEAEKIEGILRNAGIKTRRYAAYGTEGSFRALSGRGISLLHIATHGFSASTASNKQDPLACSGLLFAGCNYNHRHPGELPLDNDGILTAQEIALLNLQGLQLTVLSACQTGLGEVKEDGVFGVQRGFKKAGAQTIIMSLWSVSDAATQLMMTSFYKARINGLSRHEAFLKAQETVRDEYHEPHYWAPFIMLDDI